MRAARLSAVVNGPARALPPRRPAPRPGTRRGQTVGGCARCALVALAVGVALAAAPGAGCRRDAQPEATASAGAPIGVRIPARGRLPALEIAVVATPAVEDARLARGLAGAMTRALDACRKLLPPVRPGAVILDAALDLRPDRAEIDGPGAGPLARCLAPHLGARALGLPPEPPRRVRIQARIPTGGR